MGIFVHASAYVDEGATIGEGSKVWHFCHVMEKAQIGENVTLGQNVFVGRAVKIDNNCKIQNNVSVYEGVTLEEDVFCGPSMVFTNVNWPRSAYPQDPGNYSKTLVKRGCTIGANATVVAPVVLGRFCFVGAGSVITRDVPDYALVFGVPAEVRGWVCRCGTRLEFQDTMAKCSSCGLSYRMSEASQVVEDKEGDN